MAIKFILRKHCPKNCDFTYLKTIEGEKTKDIKEALRFATDVLAAETKHALGLTDLQPYPIKE